LHDVVPPAMHQQVPEDAETEPQLRPDAPPPMRIQLRPSRNCNDVDVGHARAGIRVPLEQRQVRDRVPAPGHALREVAIPALGTAHGVRIQAVENEANTHEMPSEGLQTAKEVEFQAT
jgi:hypothetical protein